MRLLLLLGILACATATAGDEAGLQQLIGPRPDIADYQQREDFVRDVLAWEKRKEEVSRRLASGALKLPEKDSAQDWHHVTGPEDLDTALRNAQGYVQPNYKQTYRFHRTTHISFPLKRLPADQLAKKRIEASQAAGEGINDVVNELTQAATDIGNMPETVPTEAVKNPSITHNLVETRLR